MATPKYKTEVYVPIHKDDQSFEQRQKGIWDEMHDRMEKRRREWEDEVEGMRRDFFKLKPSEIRRDSTDSSGGSQMNYNAGKDGSKNFTVSFDVSQFLPEEINVRTQDKKLIVHAKHEEKGPGKSVCREFSRSVDVPRSVDPEQLACTLSTDGILQIEAPVNPGIEDARPKQSFPMYMEKSKFEPMKAQQSQIKSGQSFVETDGSRKFKISVDIGPEFGPQDILVKTIDRKLVVQAKHEVKSEGRTSCKEFSRQFDLPENVDPNLVTASLAENGKLIVEAPISGSSFSHGQITGKPGSTKQPTVTISFDRK